MEKAVPRALTTLDLDLVRTFVTIATLGRFTQAALRLGRQQSTISLQITRLEQALGARLLERSPRAVALTEAGAQFLPHAQRLLALNDEAVASLQEPALAGLVRLGTPEDFATAHLPQVLARFTQAYPAVTLEVTCDLTLNLLEGFRAGRFDLVLAKREPAQRGAAGMPKGLKLWREALVWVSGPAGFRADDGVVKLVVSPEPCVYRKRAITSLERAGLAHRIAYTCGALSGAIAAVKAGLGIAVLPRDMVPEGLHVCTQEGLPALHDTEIALLDHGALGLPGQRLKEHIARALG